MHTDMRGGSMLGGGCGMEMCRVLVGGLSLNFCCGEAVTAWYISCESSLGVRKVESEGETQLSVGSVAWVLRGRLCLNCDGWRGALCSFVHSWGGEIGAVYLGTFFSLVGSARPRSGPWLTNLCLQGLPRCR